MKYQGNCHCKSVKFEFESREIAHGLSCNCSICSRRGMLMNKDRIEPKDFKFIEGENTLGVYKWGDEYVNHYFCKNCGVAVYNDLNVEPNGVRVNLHCVDTVDVTRLEVTYFDGKNEL